MSKIELKQLLRTIFATKELNYLSYKTLNIKLDLNEVEDLDTFLEECKNSKRKKIAGAHRINDWEEGWSGKGIYYSKDDYNNTPYYFKNSTHIRLGQKIYKDNSGFAELEMLRALQIIILKKFLNNFNSKVICEYGCGTGSNINFIKNNFKDLIFFGSDWTKSACNNLIKKKILKKNYVFNVNYFNPATYNSPNETFIAFTNASLEQTGDKYKKFMNYLIEKSNCLGGIHIEPIRELLDLRFKTNKQSYDYAASRGYLKNFYKFMVSNSKVKILEAKDFGIGSKFISGYQILCWKKK